MRRSHLALAALAALLASVALPAAAADHDPAGNHTTFPDEMESTQAGPRDESPVSWVQVVVVLVFLGGVGAVLLTLRRFRRQDGKR